MTFMEEINFNEIAQRYEVTAEFRKWVEKEWQKATGNFPKKIIVLDDDLTGIQTVSNVWVMLEFDQPKFEELLKHDKLIYICTNSRVLSSNEAKEIYKKIAQNLIKIMEKKKEENNFLLICRNDSTLRGHYPLETNAIIEAFGNKIKVDGEILIPFFKEGERYTIDNIHYIKEGEKLIPVNKTEFARDKRFGYSHANLCKWIEEKTNGIVKAQDVITIPLELLRKGAIEEIEASLMKVENCRRIVVNAIDYLDLKVFCIALIRAIRKGKFFLFRTAASFVPIIAGMQPSQGISVKEWEKYKSNLPGFVIVGSYIKKSSKQLEKLKELNDVKTREIKLQPEELKEIITFIHQHFESGQDVCIYTPRNFLDNYNPSHIEKMLKMIVGRITANVSFMVVKGGSTSYTLLKEVNNEKIVRVLGAIIPGVPVVELSKKSKFREIPYVIFPGNVGKDDDLKNLVQRLREYTKLKKEEF